MELTLDEEWLVFEICYDMNEWFKLIYPKGLSLFVLLSVLSGFWKVPLRG